MPIFAANHLRNFAAKLLAAGGFTQAEAEAIATSLLLSEVSGHGSHGLMRVREYLNDLKKGATISGATLRIPQETSNSVIADAQHGAGQVVMPALLDRLYAKLATQAVVTAAISNCGHIGRVGEWVERAAQAGYPGLLLVNDNGVAIHVAPPGGKQAVTSTNPLAFAVPLPDGEIFLADMSTSAIAFGKVRLARLSGDQVPHGCIQDADGAPTNDPEALFTKPAGSLLPMGGDQGYKGFALSMFIDLLVAGLSGGQTPPATAGTAYANNLVLTLWNPKFFAGLEHMQQQAQKYIDAIRASAPTQAEQPIRLPGDRASHLRRERESNGVPLSDGLWQDLLALAQSLGVTVEA